MDCRMFHITDDVLQKCMFCAKTLAVKLSDNIVVIEMPKHWQGPEFGIKLQKKVPTFFTNANFG